jgi:hypothetical protein
MFRVITLVFLALMGCSRSTAPDRISLGFESSLADSQVPRVVRAIGDENQIQVSGVFETPGGGFVLRADLVRALTGDPTEFVLQVRARQPGGGTTFPTPHSYQALITGVPSGQHSIRVVHIVESSSMPWRTPLETSVWVQDAN